MIVKAESNHLKDITAIENQSFGRPWSLQSFLSEFSNITSSNWVYMKNNRVAGYLFGWKIDYDYHINNIAVDLRLFFISSISINFSLYAHICLLQCRYGYWPSVLVMGNRGIVEEGEEGRAGRARRKHAEFTLRQGAEQSRAEQSSVV